MNLVDHGWPCGSRSSEPTNLRVDLVGTIPTSQPSSWLTSWEPLQWVNQAHGWPRGSHSNGSTKFMVDLMVATAMDQPRSWLTSWEPPQQANQAHGWTSWEPLQRVNRAHGWPMASATRKSKIRCLPSWSARTPSTRWWTCLRFNLNRCSSQWTCWCRVEPSPCSMEGRSNGIEPVGLGPCTPTDMVSSAGCRWRQTLPRWVWCSVDQWFLEWRTHWSCDHLLDHLQNLVHGQRDHHLRRWQLWRLTLKMKRVDPSVPFEHGMVQPGRKPPPQAWFQRQNMQDWMNRRGKATAGGQQRGMMPPPPAPPAKAVQQQDQPAAAAHGVPQRDQGQMPTQPVPMQAYPAKARPARHGVMQPPEPAAWHRAQYRCQGEPDQREWSCKLLCSNRCLWIRFPTCCAWQESWERKRAPLRPQRLWAPSHKPKPPERDAEGQSPQSVASSSSAWPSTSASLTSATIESQGATCSCGVFTHCSSHEVWVFTRRSFAFK